MALEVILGLQTAPRRCVADGPMVAGAILGAQNLSSSIIAFPKRLKATSIDKIRIEIKIFFGSGGPFGAHLDPPNRSQTLRQRLLSGSQRHFESSKLRRK